MISLAFGFNLIYWTPICGKYFLFWENVEKYGKTAVFPGGYGRIGEISHGRLWPGWGLKEWCSKHRTDV